MSEQTWGTILDVFYEKELITESFNSVVIVLCSHAKTLFESTIGVTNY